MFWRRRKKRISSGLNKKNIRAFSLVELLVTIAILSVVIVGIFTMFATGINIWKKSQLHNVVINKFSIFGAWFSSELRNSILFPTFGFSGSETSVAFAYFNDEEISKVTYYFDSTEGKVYRSYISLEDLTAEKSASEREMLTDVEAAEFSYYVSSGDEELNWQDTWEDKEELPKAVKIELIIKGSQFNTKVWMPLAN